MGILNTRVIFTRLICSPCVTVNTHHGINHMNESAQLWKLYCFVIAQRFFRSHTKKETAPTLPSLSKETLLPNRMMSDLVETPTFSSLLSLFTSLSFQLSLLGTDPGRH